MADIIITAAAAGLSALYVIFRIVRFFRKPAGVQGCGCSCDNCSGCPAVKRN